MHVAGLGALCAVEIHRRADEGWKRVAPKQMEASDFACHLGRWHHERSGSRTPCPGTWQTLSKAQTGGGQGGFHVRASWELSWNCKTWTVGMTGTQCDCKKVWGWGARGSEIGTRGRVDRHASSATSSQSTFMISLCRCHVWCSKAIVLTQG